MQDMFHKYPKPIPTDNNGLCHPDDNLQAHMRFLLRSDTEERWPRHKVKGLAHDMIIWGEACRDDVSSCTLVYSFTDEGPQKPYRGSSDLRGSSSTNENLRRQEFIDRATLLNGDANITHLIEEYVKLCCPELYKKLKLAFERGNWVKEELPAGTRQSGGVFLGRVTLYKLQTGSILGP